MAQEVPKAESGARQEKLPDWVSTAKLELDKFKKLLLKTVKESKDSKLLDAARYNLEDIEILDDLRRTSKVDLLGYWVRVRDLLSENDSWFDWDEETVAKLFPKNSSQA